MYSSITPRRSSCSCGLCVRTFMPGSAGVVHEAGKPLRPSICTRHRRQEPKGSRLSVAHSLGTLTPPSMAARISEVPSGTQTSRPSISSVIRRSDGLAGVPQSACFKWSSMVFSVQAAAAAVVDSMPKSWG